MPRIPEEEIERVKRETDLVALVQSRGIELKKHGTKDWCGLCPFHQDKETPNFIVTLSKGLFHCMSCGKGGNPIQFVQYHDGVSFRHAYELLKAGGKAVFTPAGQTSGPLKVATIPRLPCPLDPEADDATLFGQVVAYYHQKLKETPTARAYLASRGLDNDELIDRFQLGFADRTLGLRLPDKNRQEGERLRTRLTQLGLWRDSGHEHFNGCIVVPFHGEAGTVVSLYGRRVTPGTLKHLYPPGPHRGLFNRQCLPAEEIILCEAVLDALTFCANGFPNATCLFGTEGFTDELWEALRTVKRVRIAYDADDAGERAAQRDAERFREHGIEVFRVKFPHGMDANEYACKVKPAAKSLALLMNSAAWLGWRSSGLSVLGSGKQSEGKDETALPEPHGVAACHRPGAENLPTHSDLSQARDVCAGRSDATGSSVDPGEHCGGTGSGTLEGVCLSPECCQGEHGGAAHATDRGPETGLSGRCSDESVGGRAQPSSSSPDWAASQAQDFSRNSEPTTQNLVPSRNPEPIAHNPSLVAASVSRSGELPKPAAKKESHSLPTTQNPEPTTLIQRDGCHFLTLEAREYRVAGLEKTLGTDALKVALRLSYRESFHLDQVDLSRDQERRRFIERAAEETGLTADLLKRDLGKLLLAVEQAQVEILRALSEPRTQNPQPMSPEEREEALDWLKAPNLIERLREAFRNSGIIGEEINILVAYLACVSRKLERPLAIIIQSASASGKTTLMDAVLNFFPEEERIKYSAMTGQSLYYLGETNLKHKILAVVEEAGAEKASYALKLLQSEGELTIASTGKDPQTGKMVTQEYHVEGPVMIFLTTTAIDLDEELQNRCLTLAVDETPEQTGRIHQMQRERRTLAGLIAREERKDLLKKLHNAQRLLVPIEILNPYAPKLTFATTRTRNRRDHEKYLTLIDAIALLHQHQRERRFWDNGSGFREGRSVPRTQNLEPGTPPRTQNSQPGTEYVEVTLEDIALANQLAPEVLARSLDELPPQTRRLLGHIRALLKNKRENAKGGSNKMGPGSAWFSRKELREASGWSLTQVSVHLERLVALEYVTLRHGRLGSQFVYEAFFDIDASETVAHIGLIDVESLAHDYDLQVSGFERGVSGGNGQVTGGNQTGPIPSLPLSGSALDARCRGNGNAHLEEGALTPTP